MITAAPDSIAARQASVRSAAGCSASRRRSTTRPRQLVISSSRITASKALAPSNSSISRPPDSTGGMGTVGSNALWVLTGQLRAAYPSSRTGRDGLVATRSSRVLGWAVTAQALARCRATTPPDRFRHSTSRQPASPITAASPGWSGQAWMDSARYS